MWKAFRENPRAVTYAVLMHVGLLALLMFSLDWTPKSVKPGTTQPIKAELVDMSKLRKLEAQKQAEADAKRKAEQDKQRKLEAEKQKKLKQEKQRKAEVEKKKKAEQEKKRKVASAKKKKAEQEKQRKVEAAKQKKAEQEKQRKAEAAKQKKAEEATRQREAEQALQAQLAEEAAQARAESALSEYIPYIQQKVQNNWLRPAGSPPGLSCVILVKLIPGGEVVGTRVVQSSGNTLFDQSVERAVQKASPLPLPEDQALFKYFREINFKFVPD